MSMIMWFVLMIAVSTVWLVWFLKNPLKSNLFNLENLMLRWANKDKQN